VLTTAPSFTIRPLYDPAGAGGTGWTTGAPFC